MSGSIAAAVAGERERERERERKKRKFGWTNDNVLIAVTRYMHGGGCRYGDTKKAVVSA